MDDHCAADFEFRLNEFAFVYLGNSSAHDQHVSIHQRTNMRLEFPITRREYDVWPLLLTLISSLQPSLDYGPLLSSYSHSALS